MSSVERCPKCGWSKKKWMERSPYGRSCCDDCGFIGLHTEWIKQVESAKPVPHNDQEAQLSEAAENHAFKEWGGGDDNTDERACTEDDFISGARWMAERKDAEFNARVYMDAAKQWALERAALQSKLTVKDAELASVRMLWLEKADAEVKLQSKLDALKTFERALIGYACDGHGSSATVCSGCHARRVLREYRAAIAPKEGE
jgi:hypothetical protein